MPDSAVLSAVQKGQLVIIAGYAFIFLATFIVFQFLSQEQEAQAAEENLGAAKDRKASNGLVKISRFFNRYFLSWVRGKAYWDGYRASYRRKLIAAGLREEFNPDEFIAFKFFMVFFFPVVGIFLTLSDVYRFEGNTLLMAAVGGWFYPDLWMKGRITNRQRQVRRSMPFIVDLLALSTEAGLDFVGSIGKVVEKARPSPLVEELDQVLKEIKVGSSRADALREMASRLDMAEMNSFVAILISADQMGAPIGRTLRQQSEQIRVQRFLAAEKAGAAAAQKLLIPTILFILPAVMLMIMGPIIVQYVQGGGR
jgi:tight adherence protein C